MKPTNDLDGKLTKNNRLRYYSQFASVLKHGNISESEWVIVAIAKRKAQTVELSKLFNLNRLGICFERKCIRKAVQRNLVKRSVRALFREMSHLCEGSDIVVRIRRMPAPFTKAYIRSTIAQLLKKALT